MSGTVVVGWAKTSSRETHAFAYDLAAAEPVMQDLGTLGGRFSRAADVDGSVVVGSSTTDMDQYEVQGHAFANDLAADRPTMVNLETLGHRASGATGVDGDLVVGWSGGGGRHAFVVDLAADEPVMQDLGTFDGDTSSQAAAVADGLLDFGTLGGARSWSTGVAGDIVIGEWRRGRWRARQDHGFAHDLAAEDPRTLVLGSWRGSRAQDIDGDVVVGSRLDRSGRSHATAWVLRETTRPMLAFRRFEHEVDEDAGQVRVQVERYGRTDRAVTVRYRTRSATATAGKDFVATSGMLRFASGVATRSFRVKILDDRRGEGHEDLVLSLSRPGGPAILGSPRWTELRITKNDR